MLMRRIVMIFGVLSFASCADAHSVQPALVASNPVVLQSDQSPDGGAWLRYPVPTRHAGLWGITDGGRSGLWFTEQSADKVGHITLSGAIKEYALGFDHAPNNIVMGADGKLYISDGSFPDIIIVTQSGHVHYLDLPPGGGRAWGISRGVDGNVWYMDGSRIGRITPAGQITVYTTPAQEEFPTGAVVQTPDGMVWFADEFNQMIGKLDPTTGNVVEYPINAPAFCLPGSIAYSHEGDLWFTCEVREMIGHMATSGVVLGYVNTHVFAQWPNSIVDGPDGGIWEVGRWEADLAHISPTGHLVKHLAPPGFKGSGVSIAAGADGNMWYTDSRSNVIGVYVRH